MNQQDYNNQIIAIYDFETVIPQAIIGAFTAYGMAAYDLKTAVDFQEKRPRVELVFTPGMGQFAGPSGQTIYAPVLLADATSPPSNCLIPGTYGGILKATIYTDSKERSIHAAYRSQTRWILDTIKPRVNGTLLTNHRINFVTPTATNLEFSDDKGFHTTDMFFDIQFAIEPAAFNPILQPATS